jgi:hypothetical protein
MEELKVFIQTLLETPIEDNKVAFSQLLKNKEIELLEIAEECEFKSQEYFNKRNEAFSLRREIAMYLVPLWISKFGSLGGCPLQFSDTLNIPFRVVGK